MANDQNCLGRRTPVGRAPVEMARVPLDTILNGAREIIIVHNGEDYRLRVTARGKLILTK